LGKNLEKPKYSCIVVVHRPNKRKGYYGNLVAAPVFKTIAHKLYSAIPKEASIDINRIQELATTQVAQPIISSTSFNKSRP
jgi:cell division protein FtsI (penicillin-binding protein 3)